MKAFLKYSIILILVLCAVLIAIPFLIDVNQHHSRITKWVSEKTGYELAMGHIDLHLLPTLNLSISDIRVTHPNQPLFVFNAEKVKLNLEVMPLLKKHLIINDFELKKPFVRYPKGTKLTLAQQQSSHSKAPLIRVAAPASDPGEIESHAAAGWSYSFEGLTIDDGKCEYRDGFKTQLITSIHGKAKLKAMDGPAEAKLSFQHGKEKYKLKAHINNVQDLLDHEVTKIALDASVGDWKLAVASSCSFKDHKLRFQKLETHLNELKLQGTMTINLAEARPNITGSLHMEPFELDDFLKRMSGSSSKKKLSQHSDFSLISSAYAQTSKKLWEVSEDPILDFAFLESFTASVGLKTKAIKHPKFIIDSLDGTLNVRGGEAIFDVVDAKFYDGSGTMMLKASQRRNTPLININLKIDALNSQKLLKDMIDVDYVTGKASLRMKTSFFGNNTKLLVESMNGDGSFSLPQGTILRVQEIASNKLPFKSQLGDELPFEKLSGTWVMENGVATSNDLMFVSPLLSMHGKGNSNFITQEVKYNVVMDHIELLDKSENTKGASIGIIMYGPMAEPQFTIDLTHLILNLPDKLQGNVKKIIEKPTQELEKQLNKHLNKLLKF